MNKIDSQIQKIKTEKRLGLMTHVVVGYPTIDKTESLVKTMVEVGADFIELQIPFSDPLADGPTIMKACEEVLRKRVKVKNAFKLASKLSKKVKIPLLFMAYYNTVFKYGTRRFCQDAKKVGISGLIVPDVPIEEECQEHFIKYCHEAGLKNIRVISPVSTVARLKKNAKIANGFIYCTARQGITGAKNKLDPQIISYLKQIRRYLSIPIAVGFGISKSEHTRVLKPYADIIVVGSALLDVINKSGKKNYDKNIRDFLRAFMVH